MAGPATDSTGQIQKREANPGQQLAGLLQKMQPEIARALPRHLNPDRIARIALTALRTTKHLGECTPASFMGSVLSLAQLGLEPNTPLGQAWLIPRKNRRSGQYECGIIIGYQGMLDIGRRSPLAAGSAYAHVVREGDKFHYELGLEQKLMHVPAGDADRERRPITHAYAVMPMKEGPPIFTVLTIAQIEARRARSASPNDGPWITDYEAMCLKTAVRALWRWMPKTAEMATAVALEDAPEAGRSQALAYDNDVTDALAKQGLEAQDAETTETVEEKTTLVEDDPASLQAAQGALRALAAKLKLIQIGPPPDKATCLWAKDDDLAKVLGVPLGTNVVIASMSLDQTVAAITHLEEIEKKAAA